MVVRFMHTAYRIERWQARCAALTTYQRFGVTVLAKKELAADRGAAARDGRLP